MYDDDEMEFDKSNYFEERLADQIKKVITETQTQGDKDIIKLLKRIDFDRFKSIEVHLIKIESMLSELYDAGILTKKECTICGNETDIFLPHVAFRDKRSRANVVCPHCGSFDRHRCYWLIMKEWFDVLKTDVNVKLLHFAPEQCFRTKIEKYPNIDYWPVDIDGKKDIRKVVDITNIPFEDNEFDYIICNHVLEHVQNDKKAMTELYRVLKPEGKAMINVPIKRELKKTLEEEKYNTAELRKRYYGQSDHLRQYGADFGDKLKAVGFKVTFFEPTAKMTETELKKYGLAKDETVFVCEKQG